MHFIPAMPSSDLRPSRNRDCTIVRDTSWIESISIGNRIIRRVERGMTMNVRKTFHIFPADTSFAGKRDDCACHLASSSKISLTDLSDAQILRNPTYSPVSSLFARRSNGWSVWQASWLYHVISVLIFQG